MNAKKLIGIIILGAMLLLQIGSSGDIGIRGNTTGIYSYLLLSDNNYKSELFPNEF
jgi:hypothetical protein